MFNYNVLIQTINDKTVLDTLFTEHQEEVLQFAIVLQEGISQRKRFEEDSTVKKDSV